MVVLIMGVSGSGKTTIGQLLARDLGWSFRDADAFHPPENVAKMSVGTPLTDRDREPWLAAIRAHIEDCLARGESGVVTCSALKQRYRAIVAPDRERVKFVHLTGDFDLILSRMNARPNHFMRPEMLRSQFAALESPRNALIVDVAPPPAKIVQSIRQQLNL
jgi:gluconokinase